MIKRYNNTIFDKIRTCIHNIFAMKNEINRQPAFYKQQGKNFFDSYSIKQVFDEEKQDLACFYAKAI